jgi:hypothetical protein
MRIFVHPIGKCADVIFVDVRDSAATSTAYMRMTGRRGSPSACVGRVRDSGDHRILEAHESQRGQ